MHYGKTMEILLCDQVQGAITIDTNTYAFENRQVFLIPPKIVHSTHIAACEGVMYVLKIDFEMLKNYIDLSAMFAVSGKALSAAPFSMANVARPFAMLSQIVAQTDVDIFYATAWIAEFFQLIFAETPAHTEDIALRSSSNRMLRTLICWTEQNYNRKILLEEVADVIGYSKYYFCSTFRNLTGVTYIHYLNSVRLSHACSHLLEGKSVSEACYSCGFEDVSYFVQLFKRTYHLTPQQYKKQLGIRSAKNELLP